MNKIMLYVKKEPVLSIAFVLAVVSAFAVPPGPEYAEYINFSVLSILFCLMLVVAGFQSAGLFDAFTQKVFRMFKTEKALITFITFVCFFVFVGNIARIDAVNKFVSEALEGRELVFSALISQVISNVPAATMLSSFTDNGGQLILGTNIGGLGTLIASMASLISYRQICAVKKVKTSEYILFFTLINFVLLVFLLLLYTFVI